MASELEDWYGGARPGLQGGLTVFMVLFVSPIGKDLAFFPENVYEGSESFTVVIHLKTKRYRQLPSQALKKVTRLCNCQFYGPQQSPTPCGGGSSEDGALLSSSKHCRVCARARFLLCGFKLLSVEAGRREKGIV